jgi:hypothetical protein
MSQSSEPEQMSRAEQVMDPLLGQLIGAQLAMTHDVTNKVLDAHEEEILRLKATLYLIRDDIDDIVGGPYIPSPRYILDKLWPNEDRIKERMEYLKAMKR